jgi:hypothetical protein
MTGLWFEYIWTEGFRQGNEYQCSSWTILEDGGLDKPMVVYNQQTKGEEGDSGNFFQISLTWEPPCPCGHRDPIGKYTRDVPEGHHSHERSLTILRTNYYSYAVAASCGEREGANGVEHTVDYVVLSRDKSVPITIRKLARQGLLDHGVSDEQITQMEKSKTKTCWGKDFYE